MTENRYLENTHVFRSSVSPSQFLTWYTTTSSFFCTVTNPNVTKPGSKSASLRLTPEDARELIGILQGYIDEATHA